MRLVLTAEHRAKLVAGLRRARFDSLADPLWVAIARGHKQEVAFLTAKLQALVGADRKKKYSGVTHGY